MSDFERAVATRDVLAQKPLSHGRNGAVLVTYPEGVRAVVKKRRFKREKFRGVWSDEVHLNELAAYRLDSQLFRFNFVPETVDTVFEGVPSSAQKFVAGDTAPDISQGVFNSDTPNWKHKIAKFFCQVQPEVLARVVVFDLIVNNTDRHARNLMFERGSDGLISSGRVWAIDNGNIMGEDLRSYRNVFHKYMFRTHFPMTAQLRDFLLNLKLRDLSEILDPIYKDKQHAKECFARVKWVLRHRRHLDFNTVSHKKYDKNDFPSYHDELQAILSAQREKSSLPKNLKLVAGASL